MVSVAEPFHASVTAVETAVFPERVTVNTIVFDACSAPAASAAATVITGVSLSSIVPLAEAGAPTVYPVPGATVTITVSCGSIAVSFTGVTVNVAADDPIANVNVNRFAERVTPVPVAMTV